MDGCPDPPGNGNFSSPQQLQQLSQQPRDYGDVVGRHSLASVCIDLSEVASETCAFEGARFFIEHTVQHKLGPQPAFWHLPACVCVSLFDEDPSRFPSCVSLRHQPVNARHCIFATAVDLRRYRQVFHLSSFTSKLSCFFLHISSFMLLLSHMTCIIRLAVQHKLGPQPAFWHSPACVCGGLFEEACAVCFILHPSIYILHLLCSCFMFHLSHLTFLIALASQHWLGPQTAFWHSPACVCDGLFEVACAVCVLFPLLLCIFRPSCSFFMFHLSLTTLFVGVAVQHTLGLQPAFRHSPACIRGSLLEVLSAVDIL